MDVRRVPWASPQRAEREDVILRATTDLLRHTSFAGRPIEMAAQQGGVGELTGDRRWPTKAALVSDALARPPLEVHIAEEGGFRTVVRHWVADFICAAAGANTGHVFFSILGAATVDPVLVQPVRGRYLAPPMQVIDKILRRRAETSVDRSDLDISLMRNSSLGPAVHSRTIEGTTVTIERAGQLFGASWWRLSALITIHVCADRALIRPRREGRSC